MRTLLRWLIRPIVRAELEDMQQRLANHLTDLIVRNNEQIEADLIGLGLLYRDDEGELHLKSNFT
jgi:hypothetical protein